MLHAMQQYKRNIINAMGCFLTPIDQYKKAYNDATDDCVEIWPVAYMICRIDSMPLNM